MERTRHGGYPIQARLGEGYMKQGRKELAIRNYKRSLELDPNNANAITMLKKLQTE